MYYNIENNRSIIYNKYIVLKIKKVPRKILLYTSKGIPIFIIRQNKNNTDFLLMNNIIKNIPDKIF